MVVFIFGVLIFLLNLAFGIRHYQKGEVNLSAAFSWFAVGVMLPGIIIQAVALFLTPVA